jgi:hypothetical protein
MIQVARVQSNVLGQVSFLLRSDYFQGFLYGACFLFFFSFMKAINKQASIFLTRKDRFTTINAALERFACKICSPEIAQNIKELIALNDLGEDTALSINIKVFKDSRSHGKFVAVMGTQIYRGLGKEQFEGLE